MSADTAFKTLGITRETPDLYKALGINLNGTHPSSIAPSQVTGHFLGKVMPELSGLPEEQVTLIKKAHQTLSDSKRKITYDSHIYPLLNKVETATGTPSIGAAVALTEKLSIRNPVVLLGASIIAIGAAAMGLSATKRISQQRDDGNRADTQDRSLQAIGFATAGAIVSAAVLMWNAAPKAR